jgi:hypothetical protein
MGSNPIESTNNEIIRKQVENLNHIFTLRLLTQPWRYVMIDTSEIQERLEQRGFAQVMNDHVDGCQVCQQQGALCDVAEAIIEVKEKLRKEKEQTNEHTVQRYAS